MKFTISGQRLDISDALKEHTKNHVDAFCEKFDLNPVDTTVTISKEGHLFLVDIKCHIGRDLILRSHNKTGDAYGCVQGALETLAKRVRRHKRRMDHHHKHHDHHPPQHIPHYVLNGDILTSNEEDTTGEDLSPAIIAETQEGVPKISVGQAVMHLDLTGENVFVFESASSGRMNVIYRRHDGNIGWIDPK